MRRSCDRFDTVAREGSLKEIVRENLVFHDAILDIAGNDRITQLVRGVTELPLVYKSYLWYSPNQKLVSAHYHRQILHALEARDPERAESVMKQHVFEARDVLVAQVRASLAASETAKSISGGEA